MNKLNIEHKVYNVILPMMRNNFETTSAWVHTFCLELKKMIKDERLIR